MLLIFYNFAIYHNFSPSDKIVLFQKEIQLSFSGLQVRMATAFNISFLPNRCKI